MVENPIRCLVVDDEPLARSLIGEYISKLDFLELVASCPSPLQAMEYLDKNQIDILFLDIQMPELTGISFLKILEKKPLVILTTAYSQYALESYDLDVMDYLLKPITFERFFKSVNKAKARLVSNPSEIKESPSVNKEENTIEKTYPSFVFIKDGTKMIKVNLSEIKYIEGLKDYVSIYTKTQKITSLQRMKMLEDELPPHLFMRIHHSYIIALSEIEVVHKTEVKIGDNWIPISETYKKNLKDYIDRNHIQSHGENL